MILYNVTCLVDPKILDEWLLWMKDVHLPEVLATKKFVSCKMYRIDSTEGDSGHSYSIQYIAESREKYLEYVKNFGPQLKAKTIAKYGEQVHAFRTLMEEVNLS